MPNDTRHNLARIPLRWMIRQCFLANTGIRFHTQLLPNVGLDPASLYPVVAERPPALTPADIVSDEEYARLQADAAAQAATSSTLSVPTATSSALAAPSMLHNRQDSTRTLVDESPAATPAKESAPSLPLTLRKTTQTRLTTLPTGALSEEEEDLADLLCPIYDQLSLAPGWWVLEVLPMTQRFQAKDNHWIEELAVNLGRGRVVPHRENAVVKFHRSVRIREDAPIGAVRWVDEKKRGYKPVATWNEGLQIEYVA